MQWRIKELDPVGFDYAQKRSLWDVSYVVLGFWQNIGGFFLLFFTIEFQKAMGL